jgi:hypothetical protein
MPAARYSVPYLLSFDGPTPRGEAPKYKMGNGSAGWTVADFATREEAQVFADSVPPGSRVRNHGVDGPR